MITLDSLPGDPYALQVHPSGRFYPYQGIRGFPVIQCVEEPEVPVNLGPAADTDEACPRPDARMATAPRHALRPS